MLPDCRNRILGHVPDRSGMEIKSDRKSSPRGLRAPLALVLLLTFILLPAPEDDDPDE